MIWTMNEDGEYVVDPVITNYINSPENEVENGGAGLVGLFSCNLSENGKYAVCRGTIIVEDEFLYVPVVYNVEEQTFTVYNEVQDIDEMGLGLTPSAIDNDGTIIGVIGEPLYGSAGSFVLKAGETQAENFSAAYPMFAETFGMSDYLGYCVPTAISSDGRLIVGYGYYCEDFYDEDAMAYFVTYVIDTQSQTSGVKIAAIVDNDAQPEEFYSIDGKRLGEMSKGLNIVRMSDGSVRKVIRK